MHEHLMIIDINIDIPSSVINTYWLNTTNKTLYSTMEISLALLKPHVLRNTYALNQIKALIGNNFNVLEAKEVHITKELSERFYAEHKGKFFYNRLTSFMNRYVTPAVTV